VIRGTELCIAEIYISTLSYKCINSNSVITKGRNYELIEVINCLLTNDYDILKIVALVQLSSYILHYSIINEYDMECTVAI